MQGRIKTKIVFAMVGVVGVGFLCCVDANEVSAHELSISTSNSIVMDISPTGTGTAIKEESITVTSTCRNGYSLSVSTPEGSELYRYTNNVPSSNASYSAVDGTSALNSSNNTNKWGFTLTSNASGNTVFSPLASTATTIKTYAETTTSGQDINDTFSIYYGIKTDDTVLPGSYKMANDGAIVYYSTVNPSCLAYSVQYQGNGADNPNGMGTTDAVTGEKSVKQTNISEGTSVTLLASNYKRQGYGFLGWSTDEDAYAHFVDNDNSNDPIIYGPMETVVVTADLIASASIRNQINMYAVWVPALKDGSNKPVYLQEWDNSATTLPHDGCSTLAAVTFDNNEANEKDKIQVTKDAIVALTDKRDNEVYTVARLADGKCWMIENLRLDAEYTMGQNQNNVNETNQFLSQGYGGKTGVYGNFVGLAESESANFADVTASNSVYKSSSNPPTDAYNAANQTLEDIGTLNSPSYRFSRYNNANKVSLVDSITYTQSFVNPSNPTDSGTNYRTASNLYSYGNYYSWAAASADTNYYDSTVNSEKKGTSICPAGWVLPTSSGSAKDYGVLSNAYGGTGENQNGVAVSGDKMSNRLRAFPNNYLYAGRFSGSSASNRGTTGYYWSRSARSSVDAYNFYFNSTYFRPVGYEANYGGLNLRCVTNPLEVEVVLYSNNNADGVSRIYGAPDSSVALPQSSIAQSGYGFKNWNTASDGTGTSYTSSFTIPAGSTGEQLFAQWAPQYTINYVNNCMSYASGVASCTQAASEKNSVQRIDLDGSGDGSGTLKAYNEWTMTGWKIKEWTTNPDGTGSSYLVNRSYAVTGQSAGDGVTLYAHWVPIYSLQYDGNGADNPNGMGTTDGNGIKSVKQTNVSQGDSITLLAGNFKRAGYGFAGWSTDADAWTHFTDNDNSNDPVIYGPSETISAPAYPNNGSIITMYAVWIPADTSSGNPVYFQDWDGCASLASASYNSTTEQITAGSLIALTDKRDNEVYAIAKLADDNCWMIENLRLGHESTMGNNINDSTVTNQSLAQGYGGTTGVYGNFVGLATPETTSASTASNSVYKSSANPPVDTYDPSIGRLEDIGTTDNPTNRFPRYNNTGQNIINNPTYEQNYGNAPNSTVSGSYSASANLFGYGNTYNWIAAMANTNHYVVPQTTDSAGKTSENVGTSLCPKGWHLPTSGETTKEFGVLSQRHGGSGNNQSGAANGGNILSKRFRTFPNNFVYSYRGMDGRYWSRTTWNSTNASNLLISSANLSPSEHYAKSSGFQVRCVYGSV